jgi:8-oxo-dGTP pyrophosphatase MutT (NUDIX family)
VGTVRLAATVILVRPPLEVYLARRSAESAFAPGAFVFPGGTIEPQDASPAVRTRTIGLEPERVGREFRAQISHELLCDEPAIDCEAAQTLFVTALRELFEEAGVLLARTPAGTAVDARSLNCDAIAAQRSAVRSGSVTFAEFLTAHDWYADARALTLFSHWITPPSEPRRYNTHFFFGVAPACQAALADAFETHDGLWISPGEALARQRSGVLHLVYPTFKHLMRLERFDSIDAALDFARRKTVFTVMPKEVAGEFEIPASLEGAW